MRACVRACVRVRPCLSLRVWSALRKVDKVGCSPPFLVIIASAPPGADLNIPTAAQLVASGPRLFRGQRLHAFGSTCVRACVPVCACVCVCARARVCVWVSVNGHVLLWRMVVDVGIGITRECPTLLCLCCRPPPFTSLTGPRSTTSIVASVVGSVSDLGSVYGDDFGYVDNNSNYGSGGGGGAVAGRVNSGGAAGVHGGQYNTYGGGGFGGGRGPIPGPYGDGPPSRARTNSFTRGRSGSDVSVVSAASTTPSTVFGGGSIYGSDDEVPTFVCVCVRARARVCVLRGLIFCWGLYEFRAEMTQSTSRSFHTPTHPFPVCPSG